MKKSVYGTVVLSALLVLGGCAEDKSEPETAEKKVVADQGSEAAKSNSDIKVSSEHIKKLEKLLKQFPSEQPNSVVTTSVSIAEMLNILDVKPVGLPISTHKLPEGFDKIAQIGSPIEPDVEKIVSLKPDIVIGPESIQDSLEKKIKNGKVATAYIPTDSYEDLKISFEVLGKTLQKEEVAKEYLTQLEEKETAVLEDVKGKDSSKVMVLFGSGESFMLMSEKTYVGSLVKKLGAKNIVNEAKKSTEAYVPMNMEDVIVSNPDAILLVSHGDPTAALEQFKAEVKKNGAWEKLNAFKEDRVQALDYQIFGYASIVKATDGLEQLNEILYK
ncbi:ABC transporter substrate-binding protein [Viridibacillus sp. YIM B01967]|uniref:ABC transporter substrate-binding protein n=1 Tax=Viridibacillus soli TaxID=2798301 RepID=A0ABS1HBB3_9BACL|nr:ABC transporter substrate-binding protein [Viridibacillus soli]MBK3496693.1 ABC transporter substrate-binding protein [Viridibacillus soli]